MLDVLTFFVERIVKNETTTTDWLNWDEDMKMIIEFDFRVYFFVESFRIYFFVENMIESMIDRFVDVSKMKKNDSSRFFFIQITDETR
jgi:hypothetical protein